MLRQWEELFAALPVSVVSHRHPKCKQLSDLTHLLPGQVPDYCPDLVPREGHELVDRRVSFLTPVCDLGDFLKIVQVLRILQGQVRLPLTLCGKTGSRWVWHPYLDRLETGLTQLRPVSLDAVLSTLHVAYLQCYM